jgi:hypothetical protein
MKHLNYWIEFTASIAVLSAIFALVVAILIIGS